MKFKLLVSSLLGIIVCLAILVVVLGMQMHSPEIETYAVNVNHETIETTQPISYSYTHETEPIEKRICEVCLRTLCPETDEETAYIAYTTTDYLNELLLEYASPNNFWPFLFHDVRFSRANIFNYGVFTVGLNYMSATFPHRLVHISRHFGLINQKGYTYFNFTEDVAREGGEMSLVIFAESRRMYENPDLNSRDSIVVAEIEGEWHYVWLNAGEVLPFIVAPIRIVFGFDVHCTPALLVVVGTPANCYQVCVVFFADGRLQVEWLHPYWRASNDGINIPLPIYASPQWDELEDSF